MSCSRKLELCFCGLFHGLLWYILYQLIYWQLPILSWCRASVLPSSTNKNIFDKIQTIKKHILKKKGESLLFTSSLPKDNQAVFRIYLETLHMISVQPAVAKFSRLEGLRTSQVCLCKESACQCRRCKRGMFDPRVGKIPWRREWKSSPVFLPREFHGQKSLESYSTWGHKRVRCDWACMHAQKAKQQIYIS